MHSSPKGGCVCVRKRTLDWSTHEYKMQDGDFTKLFLIEIQFDGWSALEVLKR